MKFLFLAIMLSVPAFANTKLCSEFCAQEYTVMSAGFKFCVNQCSWNYYKTNFIHTESDNGKCYGTRGSNCDNLGNPNGSGGKNYGTPPNRQPGRGQPPYPPYPPYYPPQPYPPGYGQPQYPTYPPYPYPPYPYPPMPGQGGGQPGQNQPPQQPVPPPAQPWVPPFPCDPNFPDYACDPQNQNNNGGFYPPAPIPGAPGVQPGFPGSGDGEE